MLSNKAAEEKATRAPLVVDKGHFRSLEFVRGNIQSAMDRRRPTRLVLAYTRAMMLCSLFVPDPRHIVFVGLGGGSLIKFCYRHLPAARLTVIESRADVIALRRRFALPDDDARLQVLLGDAVERMAEFAGTADIVVVDGFDALGMPLALCHPKFYADCKRALRAGGVLVQNVFSYDRAYALVQARLGLIFDGQLCCFDGVAGNNHILFAVHGKTAHSARWQAWCARRQGRGWGWINRLLVRANLWWLARPAWLSGAGPARPGPR